jgi:hypothetical protein
MRGQAGSRVLVAAVLVLCWWSLPGVAGAHGDDGLIELTRHEVAQGEDGLHRVTLTVSIRHPEDGHLALDAEVRLTGASSTGVAVLPQALTSTDEPGEYAGAVDLADGATWDLTVQSAEPRARLDLRVDPALGELRTVETMPAEPAHEEGTWERLRWLALGCGIAALLGIATVLRRRARRRVEGRADAARPEAA